MPSQTYRPQAPQASPGAAPSVVQPPQALRPGSLQTTSLSPSQTTVPHWPQLCPGASEIEPQPPQALVEASEQMTVSVEVQK